MPLPGRDVTGESSGTTELTSLLLALLRAPSPNPPGDVSAAARVVTDYCQRAGLPYRIDEPAEGRANVVVEVAASPRGRHLVWNGHLDTFPAVGSTGGKGAAPALCDGMVHGRGAVDMKGGVAAFLVAARRLREQAADLTGSLSLVLVCDEETFGPHGARGLLDRSPELLGDALVSTEPSSLGLVRVAERGLLWLRVRLTGTSLHSAYPDPTEGAILRAAAMVRAVDEHVQRVNEVLPDANRDLPGDEELDRHLGPGAARITRSVSYNVGTVSGGSAVNMKPDACEVTLDLRVPDSVDHEQLLVVVMDIAGRYGGEVDVLAKGPSNRTPDDAPVVTAVAAAVKQVRGVRPTLSTGIGCTDTRLWRARGVPACVVGPDPASMGRADEYVDPAELEDLVEILVVSARSYLDGEAGPG